MKRPSNRQLDDAQERGRIAALNGFPSTPAPYEHWELIRAWMQGYDSTHPKDCQPRLNAEEPTQ